jgi:dolichol-phosphate mannosyltransferase
MNPEPPAVSIVLPCYNESGNLPLLVKLLQETIDPLKLSYEIIITDDCSKDNSWELIKQMTAKDSRISGQRFGVNCGLSAALWAGIQAARGKYIVTLDSDLQNDPRELPKLLKPLDKFDCVCGSRVASRSKGDNFVRVMSSRIANWVRNKLSDEDVSDAACSYRAFKRECVANMKFFKGMHRFMATLVKMEGFSVTEVDISTNPRHAGKANFGVWNRVFVAFYDLLAVRWMKKRMFPLKVVERIN